MADDKKWYYADNGKRKGPFTENEIATLTEGGAVTYGTMVWTKGIEGWQKIETTELASLVENHASPLPSPADKPDPDAPPPLPQASKQSRSDNAAEFLTASRGFVSRSANRVQTAAAPVTETRPDLWAWGMVAIWAVDAVFLTIWPNFGLWFSILFFCVNAFFVLLDISAMRNASTEQFSFWPRAALGFFLAPVYLYKRASWAGRKQTVFYGWLTVLAVFVAAQALSAYVFSSVSSEAKMKIEMTGPTAVNMVLFGKPEISEYRSCIRVRVLKKISDKLYRCKADLEDGDSLDVEILVGETLMKVEIIRQMGTVTLTDSREFSYAEIETTRAEIEAANAKAESTVILNDLHNFRIACLLFNADNQKWPEQEDVPDRLLEYMDSPQAISRYKALLVKDAKLREIDSIFIGVTLDEKNYNENLRRFLASQAEDRGLYQINEQGVVSAYESGMDIYITMNQ
jgi:hypothetical protein